MASTYNITLNLLMKQKLSFNDFIDWNSSICSKVFKEWIKLVEEGISQEDL